MSDYNKLMFSIKKQTDELNKKKAQIKAKAKAKAKALSLKTVIPSEKNIEEEQIKNHIIVPLDRSNQQTGFKSILQPGHRKMYEQSIRELNNHLKMKPRVTQFNLYNNNIKKPYNPPGLTGSLEWLKYNQKYLAPPIMYTDEYKRLVQLNEYRQQQVYYERLLEKVPTPAQVTNPKVLIVSCEYRGTDFVLNGCINDAIKFKNYILSIHPTAEITYLNDTPELHNYNPSLPSDAPGRWPSYSSKTFPSRETVLKNLMDLCKSPNPLLFLFFAGHGGSADDIPAPIESTMIDIDSNGVVQNTTTVADIENPKRKSTFYFCNTYGEMLQDSALYDTDIYKALTYVTSSQRMYVFTDCCHSGTILNLPYIHVGNFQYQYDSSGNLITVTAQEQDDFGHPVYDKDKKPVLTQRKTYNIFNDISNNVKNLPITNDDITSLMADANSIITHYDKQTGKNISNTKLTILSAKYPSLANLNGNIIHFAGTRDNKFSFESIIYDLSDNVIDRDGAFTWDWHRLWALGLEKFTIQKAYTCLIGLVNNPEQIPVCSTSKLSLFNNTDLLVDFKPATSSANVKISKNKSIKKNIINKKLNKKSNNNINGNKNLNKINKLVKKKVDLTKKFDANTVKAIVVAQNIFSAKKTVNKKKKAPKK